MARARALRPFFCWQTFVVHKRAAYLCNLPAPSLSREVGLAFAPARMKTRAAQQY
jgi:hypothetical protein